MLRCTITILSFKGVFFPAFSLCKSQEVRHTYRIDYDKAINYLRNYLKPSYAEVQPCHIRLHRQCHKLTDELAEEGGTHQGCLQGNLVIFSVPPHLPPSLHISLTHVGVDQHWSLIFMETRSEVSTWLPSVSGWDIFRCGDVQALLEVGNI